MSVFEEWDYKKYLRERIVTLQKGGRGQIQRLAKEIRVHPSFISQVLRGSLHLTGEQALGTAQFLGLNERETDCFLLLVQYARASTPALRRHLKRKIEQARESASAAEETRRREFSISLSDQSLFYSDWYFSAIRLLVSIPKMNTVDALAARLNIPKSLVARVLEFLVSCGLCAQKGDVYSIGPKVTHLDKSSPLVTRHHANWRMKAIQNLPVLREKDLALTSVMTVSESDFEAIVAMLREAIGKIHDKADVSPSEKLICLTMDCFEVN